MVSEPGASQGDAAADGMEAEADLAEVWLLRREFEKARDAALASLDAMSHEDADSNSGIRLSFVLGQALRELGELGDADKKLRRVYGSLTAVPDQVAVLWVALLASRGEEEEATLRRFTDAYVKLNAKRLRDIGGGAFLQLYVVDVLCEALGEPKRAKTWVETHLAQPKDRKLKSSLLGRIRVHEEESATPAPRNAKEAEESREGEGTDDPRDGLGTADQASAPAGAIPEDGRPSGGKGSDFWSSLDRSQVVVAGILGTTFLYAVYTERKAICRAATRGARAVGRFLVGE